jgi:hypothetical protein
MKIFDALDERSMFRFHEYSKCDINVPTCPKIKFNLLFNSLNLIHFPHPINTAPYPL